MPDRACRAYNQPLPIRASADRAWSKEIQDSGEATVGSRTSSSTLMMLLASNPCMSAVNPGPAPMYAAVTAAGHVCGGDRGRVCSFGVGDQGDQAVCVGVVVGPDAVRGDVEGPQAVDMAGPVRGRVVLECFGRAQGVDPELVHDPGQPSGMRLRGETVKTEPGQLMRLTPSAATARPCRTARGTMMRSQSRCSARAFAGVWWASAAAVSVRLMGALMRK